MEIFPQTKQNNCWLAQTSNQEFICSDSAAQCQVIEHPHCGQLQNQVKSTFVCVPFDHIVGCFAITVLRKKTDGGKFISHYRINHKPGSPYELGGRNFDSLKELIVGILEL